MTSSQPGQPGTKLSRRQRAAGAAAILTVVGVSGWAVAAGALSPAPEPASRAVQVHGPSSVPSGPAGSAQSESDSPASGTPDTAVPESLGLGFTALEPTPAPVVAPAPAPAPRSEPRVPAAVEVPVPSGKIINQPPPVAVAKGFDKAADVADGVSMRVSGRKAVEGEARSVGEVAGPAVRFTIEVTNRTQEPISLAETVVNAEAGADRVPAELLSGPEAAPFPAMVAPGQTVSGAFVFQIPPDQRGAVRVLFHYQAVSPVAAFEGSAPVQGEAP